MIPAQKPPDEQQRLEALYRYEILDTETEAEYDSVVQLVAHICETPMSNISFVDTDRQWFKAAVGLTENETPRDVAFCAHTILSDNLMVVPDAQEDERFRDNPLVKDSPSIRFYAGMPLVTTDGYRLGALCAIDQKPRQLTDQQRAALQVLSRHVVALLDLRAANKRIQEQNRRLEEVSDLKSRLLSIMAHDLRSPLVSIDSLLRLLREEGIPQKDQDQILREISSMLKSTDYLLNNVINWASRELAEHPFAMQPINPAALALELVESMETDSVRKGNTLIRDIQSRHVFNSDRNVLIFILRNLMVNANKFTGNGTITLRTKENGEMIEFTVSDTGVGMAPDQLDALFDWSRRQRHTGTAGEKGAGLALLFCRDFAQRIGGALAVESTPGEGTSVTLSIPK